MIFFNYTCGTCSTAYRETISCTYKRCYNIGNFIRYILQVKIIPIFLLYGILYSIKQVWMRWDQKLFNLKNKVESWSGNGCKTTM